MNPDISDSVFGSIVEAIASGVPVQAALEAAKVSRYDYDKVRRKDPIKSDAHARARQDGVDAMADDVPHIADSEPDAQRARNRIDARKWLAGVIKPREYGQRLDLTVTNTTDPAALHAEGLKRARLMRDPAAPLTLQPVEDAVIVPPGATGSTPAALIPAEAGTCFD